MASIEGVKAALVQPVEQTGQVLTRLCGAASGTNHARVLEAIQRARQGRHEPATLIQGSATAAREYVAVLG